MFFLESSLVFVCLILGGYHSNGQELRSSYIYDWQRSEWTQMADMQEPRRYHTCGLVTNNDTGEREVVVLSSNDNRRSTEIYSVEQDAWRYGPDYPEVASFVSIAQDGRNSLEVILSMKFT